MGSLIECLGPGLVAAAALLASQEPAQPGFDHEHARFSRVLAAHVQGDRVDYQALSRRRDELDLYLGELTTLDAAELASFSREQRFAFWINASNAFTLHAVLTSYPLDTGMDSLRDVGGKESGAAWKRRNVHLGHLIPDHPRADISLEEIVELVLRPRFQDARVHAVLNNACRGSPALRANAFTAAGLERELDSAARAWLADPLRTRFDSKARAIEISPILDTFRADFAREAGSLEAWIVRFAPAAERAWLESPPGFQVKVLPFDWRLNDVERPALR